MFGQSGLIARCGRARIPGVIASAALAIIGVGAFVASAQTVTPSADSCPATPTSGSSSAACVEIGEFDIYFKPNLATIPAETAVKVVLPNSGAILHNFSVTDHGNAGLQNLNISVNIDPGKTAETTINAPEGVYYFFCNQPGHEAAGMRGYVTVKKDATIITSEATVTPRAA